MLTETLRMLMIAYLLLLAVGSLFGFGSYLLAVPGRGAYSIVRLLISALTLGRLQLAPLAKRSSRHISDLKLMARDWAEERRSERLILQEELTEGSTWMSSTDVPETAAIPEAYSGGAVSGDEERATEPKPATKTQVDVSIGGDQAEEDTPPTLAPIPGTSPAPPPAPGNGPPAPSGVPIAASPPPSPPTTAKPAAEDQLPVIDLEALED